jgi:hypothetical protein
MVDLERVMHAAMKDTTANAGLDGNGRDVSCWIEFLCNGPCQAWGLPLSLNGQVCIFG